MQWTTLFTKELLEAGRNFKWIWVPLVFILFSITDPLTTYYLPVILESTGGLPEGAVLDLPTPSPAEVFLMSLGQLNTIGVLIVALITMGSISGERKSGVAELVLVKPVSYFSYVTAKWAASLMLVCVSVILGLFAGWYYTNLLFGDLSLASLGVSISFYLLWMAMVLALSMFMNTWSKTPGLVLFFTMTTIIVLSLLSNMLSHVLEWSPAQIRTYIGQYLTTQNIPDELWGASAMTLILITILLLTATVLLRKKEVA